MLWTREIMISLNANMQCSYKWKLLKFEADRKNSIKKRKKNEYLNWKTNAEEWDVENSSEAKTVALCVATWSISQTWSHSPMWFWFLLRLEVEIKFQQIGFFNHKSEVRLLIRFFLPKYFLLLLLRHAKPQCPFPSLSRQCKLNKQVDSNTCSDLRRKRSNKPATLHSTQQCTKTQLEK